MFNHNYWVKKVAVLLFLACSTVFAVKPDKAHTNYLFIQSAETGVLNVTPEKGTYQLVLKNIQPYVTYFSDRPQRVTGLLPIERFLNEWQSNAKNGFKKDAPNVGIEGIQLHAFSRNQRINVVMVLSNPAYDKKANTLTYTAQALNGKQDAIKNDIQLKSIVLFIDNIMSCPSCCCGM
ncbi:hypothetical protein [Legionella taurinensis]|uniref:hypothetical protein n=1 Tax=Legionella taurinensis TaxID=70611 RepID=UPI00299D2A4D|nr:hypothetical protein [Legionella taurinensis]MDX1837291.1 hypothetical protein [Legionella taurinensis]